jgi:hypothetical protein
MAMTRMVARPRLTALTDAGADGEDGAQAEDLHEAGVLLPEAVPGDIAIGC